MTNFPAARSSSTLIFGIQATLDLVKPALLNWWHYLFHITFYIQAYLQSVDLPIFLSTRVYYTLAEQSYFVLYVSGYGRVQLQKPVQ